MSRVAPCRMAPRAGAALLALACAAQTSAYIDVRQVGWDQRLGAQVPLGLQFRDEAARPVRLGDYFGSQPVVLVLSYFSCPELCPQVLHGVQESLQRTGLTPGADYELLAVSIDPRDTPSAARDQKAKLLSTPSARATEATASSIHLLTASNGAGAALARAVGFRYLYDTRHQQFAHPAGFLIASPGGAISRYFFGIRYPALQIRTAVVEAGHGRISALADQILLLCYHFDPTTGRYTLAVINTLRVLGIVALLSGAAGLWYLTRPPAQKQRP